jgi:hypothetical protein
VTGIRCVCGLISICFAQLALGQNSVYPPTESGKYEDYQTAGEYREDGKRRYHATYEADGVYRQPVDVEFIDATHALIPTKLTGEIYELDFNTRSLTVAYHDATCSWGDIAHVEDNLIAVTERNAEQVLLLRRTEQGWRPGERLEVAGQAHSLSWDPTARILYASGLWSQRLYRWQLQSDTAQDRDTWNALPIVDLNMCGGEILLLPKHQLVMITDAFGRNYRMLDQQTGEVLKRDKVYGHNIATLVATQNEEMVLFPHQLLNEHAQTVRGDITWGGLMSNNLRWLKVERLLNQSGQEIFKQGRFYPLGSPGNGAGDPTCLAISRSGQIAITLGGTNRVAIGSENDYYFQQLDVGYHPVACQFSPDDSSLVVVNQFSDSISLVDLADDHVEHLTLGKLRQPNAVERGEQAFFNSRLSHDGWMSCHSCHSQGHTNGQLNDNFSDQSFGTPKRVLSLLGQTHTTPYSWGGSIQTLEEQVSLSIASTMASDHAVDEKTVEDLAAFVRSLQPPPSLSEARIHISQRQETLRDGTPAQSQLFVDLGCADCHSGRWLTNREVYDVGFVDENEQRLFNPPSLVSVSQRQDVLFHDGRAASLKEMLEKQLHQLPRALSPEEVTQLVNYLERL